MHFFFDRTQPRVTYEKGQPYSCDSLRIEFEFGEVTQEDGHMPADGDMKKCFAEALINSIPRKAIAEVLEQNNIKAASIQSYGGAKVILSDKKDCYGRAMKTIELRFSIVPKEDIYESLANQILDSVNWKVTKAAIQNVGHYFWYDKYNDKAKNESLK